MSTNKTRGALLTAACLLPLAARADDMAVAINEINYHPVNSATEWVELHNLHGVNVDLSGWSLSGGINYTFLEGTVINGHGFLVIAAAPAGVPGSIGPWTGSLNNAGETIRLRNRDGRLMSEVNYQDDGDWPVGPDGTGTTLARRRPGGHSGPAAWTTSTEPGGTPGAVNFSYAGSPPKITTPVPIGATGWKYLTPGASAPAGWQTSAFNDTSWSQGQAAFYSGNAQIAEPTPAQVILSDPGVGLYGWWPFDDTLNNSAAGGTNGTAVGADFAYVVDPAFAGKTGKALRINVNASNADVATTHIACGSLPLIASTANFTWAAWVKSRQTGGNNIIFGNRYNATGTDYAPVQFIKLTPSNFEWYYNGIAEHNDYTDLVGSAAAPSAWTHFASVKNGSTLTLYINGVQTLSRTVNNFFPSNAFPFFVGGNRSGAGTTEAWAGFIDDVALWNKALPAQSIAALRAGTYNPGNLPTTATTVPATVPVPPAEVVWPATPTDLLTDSFDGPAIDTNKWTLTDQGLENTGPAGYTAAITNGQLVVSGTATAQYWYGKTLRSNTRFNARRRQEVTVDRVALTRGGPATSVARSSMWLWADAGHYVHFSHNLNEGGWSYNSNDAGGSGTLNPTGSGNNLALADADDLNGGAFQMKMVWIPGTYPGQGTVQMWKGDTLLGSHTVSNFPADFHVMLTGQARATTDIVSATFDNLNVREFTENRLNTPLASANGGSYYFRKSFAFAGDPSLTTGRLYPLVDDGAIFYLNGTEIHRQNMPGGAVTGSTQASQEVTNGFLPAGPIAIPSSAIQAGTNVLAVEVHGFNGASDPDMLFAAQVMLDEAQAPPVDTAPSLVFQTLRSAADAAGNPASAITIRNLSAGTVNLSGVEIRNGVQPIYTFTSGTLAAGASISIPLGSLSAYVDNMELALMAAGGGRQLDSRRVDSVTRTRFTGPGGTLEWATTDAHRTEIVINEIFYDGPGQSAEQWVELHNKSGAAVDISNWQFNDGISYTFAPGTSIGAGGYLVVAWNVAGFTSLHPGITNVAGPFSGEIDNDGERLRLVDNNGNIADEVRFFPGERGTPIGAGGTWPKWAAGGGASLELTDPNADNSAASAWSDSNITPGAWLNVSTPVFSGANISGDPVQWNEVLFGLLDDGEILIDDFRIIEDPGLGTQRDLTQDATFETTAIGAQPAAWRLIGTHRHSVVVADPDNAAQKVLHVKATNAYEHMHNHCSTTLKFGGVVQAINAGKTYQITCRAKWLKGSNQLHTRLYFNKGAKTTLLPEIPTGGTPGVQNSTYALNGRPFTITEATHAPAVPAVSTAATVTAKIVATSQTITTATLTYTAIDGGAGSGSAAMSLVSGNTWSGQIPGQTAGRRFSYTIGVTGSGGGNATAFGGYVQWNDNAAVLSINGVNPTNLRIIMSDADRTFLHTNVNVMSNDRLPCTIIENERDVYNHCSVRLKGSERGRNQPVRVGFNLTFPPENLYRGVMPVITIDRSGAGNEFSQKEMLVKHMITHAGRLPSMEDDLVRIVAPQAAQNGPAMLTRRYDGDWLNDQFDGAANDGTMFEYELIYYPTSTSNGNVEGPKLPEPDNVVGVGVNSLGANPELYRWHWLIKNRRELDDYASLIPVLGALGTGAGAAFNAAATQYLEPDEWTRSFAAQILCGIGDGYSSGAQHNALIYVPPAGSGLKAMYFPWDMDFSFNTGATSSMTPNNELNKFLANPVWKRLYWGHVYDICTTSYNTTYLTPWAQHYTKFVNQDLTSFLTYIGQRNNYALAQVTANVPSVAFAITTATGGSPGANFSAPGPLVTLDGDGWVNVLNIRVNGGAPVPVTWLDDNSWRISVPILSGPNNFLIEALGPNNAVVGSDTITITGTSAIVAASSANIALSELMYNPAAADAEYIELLNVSSNTVDFSNCYFSQGITFTFTAGTQVPPGGRILVIENQAGFTAAYPGFSGQIAAGAYGPGTALSNGGENLTLLAADGSTIFTVGYDDNITSTDGGGRSLVRILSSTSPGLTTYEWRASLTNGGTPGGTDAIPFTGTPGADVDKDGFSALAEYYLGTSDTDPASRPALPAWPVTGNTLTLVHTRRAGADDAVIEPFLSDNLTTWAIPAGWTPDGTVTPLAGGLESIAYPPLSLPPTDPREFFRLTVRPR